MEVLHIYCTYASHASTRFPNVSLNAGIPGIGITHSVNLYTNAYDILTETRDEMRLNKDNRLMPVCHYLLIGYSEQAMNADTV